MQNKSRLLVGSINVTRVIEELNAKNNAFYKSPKNGDIYLNTKIWLNEEPDQFKNDGSIQINPPKDSEFTSKYIGNVRFVEMKSNEVTDNDLQNIPDLSSIEIDNIGNEEPPF